MNLKLTKSSVLFQLTRIRRLSTRQNTNRIRTRVLTTTRVCTASPLWSNARATVWISSCRRSTATTKIPSVRAIRGRSLPSTTSTGVRCRSGSSRRRSCDRGTRTWRWCTPSARTVVRLIDNLHISNRWNVLCTYSPPCLISEIDWWRRRRRRRPPGAKLFPNETTRCLLLIAHCSLSCAL